ncbi:MAG: HD domain-containing protein [Clostridiales bacterium]|nr:HD domain-containing protein [Clostridiales bacterium]
MFEKAVDFAMKAHKGQNRKDGSIYILHPLEAATIVGTMTKNEELLAAAVLHDTVEDTSVTSEDIAENFGTRIAELVAHETENKRRGLKASDTWKIRKEEALAVLKESDIETKILWLGDKLSNMRSIAREYDEIGVAVFERFNQKNPKEQYWYHSTILEYTKDLSDYPAYKEYKNLVDYVFNNK